MRTLGKRLVVVGAVSSLTAGCCTSLRRAAEINDELRRRNIARAGPAMLSAAQRQRATLLPDQPLALGLTPICGASRATASNTEGYCVLDSEAVTASSGGLSDAYRLLDQEGQRRVAISIGKAGSWARLARRGNTLLLLVPAETLRQVDDRVQCACEGGPVIVSMSGYVNLGSAFVLNDLQDVEIQPIIVPVVDDYVEWQCKSFLVRREPVPHRAVAGVHAAASLCFRSWPNSRERASRQ